MVGDGINFFHSDLYDKFIPGLSVDITTDFFVSLDGYTAGLFGEEGDLEFLPYSPKTIRGTNRTDYGMNLLSQTHGTSVASLAAGSPDDGTCGSGVAPSAMVSSVRLLGDTNEVTELEEATALSFKCAVYKGSSPLRGQENMIYVSSWGPADGASNQPVSMSDVTRDAMRFCSEQGREGRGSVYIQAAGNGFQAGDSVDIDGYASNRYTVSVGSITYTGYPTYYSEGGESLMVVAPSSQGSMGITTASTVASFFATRVSMIKHFLAYGRTSTSIGDQTVNIHSAYSSPLGDGCTHSFGGTSASAPMIAGVVALMMESNPMLTWKDVHDILIRSAEKPHLHYDDEATRAYREISIRAIIGSGEEEEEGTSSLDSRVQENFFIFFSPPDPLEWLVNEETNLHHSYRLGFGMPDAEKAVNMARQRRINPNTQSIQDDYKLVIPSEELVSTMRFDYMSSGVSGEEDKVGFKEIGVWYVDLGNWGNEETLRSHTYRLYDKRRNLDTADPLVSGGGESHNRIGDMRIEQVELYINATLPASIDNVQLALCDHQKVCSLFLRGKDYDDTHLVQDHLDYTFTTLKHWGQRLGGLDKNWSIMLRNNFPFRYAQVVVHTMELRIYGHFSGE